MATDAATTATRARARAVPAWVWLAGIVALSALTRYALARPNDVETIVATKPARFPHWGGVFRVFHDLLGLLDEGTRAGKVEAAVAARRFVEQRRVEFERTGIDIPELPTSVAAWPAVQRWAIGVARSYARNV